MAQIFIQTPGERQDETDDEAINTQGPLFSSPSGARGEQ